MRKETFALIIVCLLSPVARAQDGADRGGGSKVLAQESVRNQAEEKGDIRALGLIFDDALVYVDEEGSLLNKEQFLAHAANRTGAHLQWLVTPTMSVDVYGDTAVVAGSYRARGVEPGKPHQREGRFIDIWILKKGTWVCVAAQATPVQR